MLSFWGVKLSTSGLCRSVDSSACSELVRNKNQCAGVKSLSGRHETAAGPRAYLSSISCISCLNTNTVNSHTHTHSHAHFLCLNNTVLYSCDLFKPWGNLPVHTRTPHTHTHTHTHTDPHMQSIFLPVNSWVWLSLSRTAQYQLCRNYTGSCADNCNKTVQIMKAGPE